MTDYAAITDWVDYVRDLIARPGAYPEMGDDTLSVEAGLSKVNTELRSTPFAARFSDAALRLIESSPPALAEQLLQVTPYGVPDAGARIAALVRRWWGGPLEGRIRTLLLRGLEAAPRDPQLLAALGEFAGKDTVRAGEALDLAVPHNIDWVVDHLGLMPAAVDPDGRGLRDIAVRTKNPDLPALLAGIAAAGPDYVGRLVSALAATDALPHQVARLRPFLAAQPAFAGLVP
jgi:hypothetical protein